MEQAVEKQIAPRTKSYYLLDRERFLGSVFLLPAVLYIFLLVGVPFFIALAFSVTDVTVGDTDLNFIGLENFRNIIKTPQFQRALVNSFVFTIAAQVLVIILANILALIFYEDFRGKWIARLLIIMPWATPISLGTIGWLWLLDSKFSPFDWVLQRMGLLGPDTLLGPGLHLNYLGREELAMAAVIMVQVWRLLPLATVILLAGLSSIDKDYIDQAKVDGATFWRIHRQIRLPLIWPIMSIALLFGLIFSFGDMVVVFVLTRGGPVYYTQVLPVWAWFKGIDGGSLSQGAAIALFLFPMLLAVAILLLRTAKRTEVF
ncbi:MAG: carbohydrate ABC transporter permease [Candidatus Promineifilaceae bacterium]